MTVGPRQLEVEQLRHLDWWKVLFNSGMTDTISVFWAFSKLLVTARILERASAGHLEQKGHTSVDWNGPLVVDLKGANRRMLELMNNPMPFNADGGIDLKRVVSITMLNVVDCH